MFIYFRYSDIYKCTKGGHCQITLKTRKNCQFCRFQACEKAGMKRSWVLADGEVKSKKAGNNDVKMRRPRPSANLIKFSLKFSSDFTESGHFNYFIDA